MINYTIKTSENVREVIGKTEQEIRKQFKYLMQNLHFGFIEIMLNISSIMKVYQQVGHLQLTILYY